MKKIILSVLVATSFLISGCLKDKDFEDQIYGTQPNDIQGIGFKNTKFALALAADATPQTILTVIVGLNADRTSATPINYTVTAAPNLVPAGITALNANAYSFSASGVIPAGQYFDTLEIVINNASLLDPLQTYGLGLTLTSTDAGYVVISNSSNVFVQFNVKNKYDGRYMLSGIHNRPPYNAFPFSNITMDLVTSGASSVDVFYVARGEYALPIGTSATGVSSYGSAISPRITFDPVTNNVISVSAVVPTPGVSLFLGPNPGKWDPATRTVTFQMFYTTGANQNFGNRGWDLTFRYTGTRP